MHGYLEIRQIRRVLAQTGRRALTPESRERLRAQRGALTHSGGLRPRNLRLQKHFFATPAAGAMHDTVFAFWRTQTRFATVHPQGPGCQGRAKSLRAAVAS